jgi:hypothetical protein
MTLFYIIYALFCFGFGLAYGNRVEEKLDKFGVGLMGMILCPLIIGLMIHECLNIEEE